MQRTSKKKHSSDRLVVALVFGGFLILLFAVGKSVIDLATGEPSTIDLAADDQIDEGFLPVYVEEAATADPTLVAIAEEPEAQVTTEAFPTPLPGTTAEPVVARDPGVPPVRIEIDSIALEADIVPVEAVEYVYEGDSYLQWLAPDTRAVGWHNTSVGLGVVGNTVLNGHHNIKGQVFRDLYRVEVGDEIDLYDAEDEQYRYVVVYTDILPERNQPLEVRLANAEWIAATDDERITLITCWPYESNTHRVVVVAVPLRNGDGAAG